MRYHDFFAYLPSSGKRALMSVVSPENLAVARLEPVYRQLRQTVMMDLAFSDGRNIAAVTGIVIDGAMISERENTPIIWPRSAYEAVEHEILHDVQNEVEYWLFSHSIGKSLNDPGLWVRHPEFLSTYEYARAHGFAGAADYRDVALHLAPYVYATRHAPHKRVGIRGANASAGAVLVAKHASGVTADLGDSALNAAANTWYGCEIFRETASEYDVGISEDGSLRGISATIDLSGHGRGHRIDVARPVPVEVMISFDPEDSANGAQFHVDAISPVLRTAAGYGAAAAIGGSSGVIAFAMREDAVRADDADSDDALELARRLRNEGFDVRAGAAHEVIHTIADVDLLHVSTLAHPDQMLPLLRAAREARKPIVARANLDDVVSGPAWGMALSHMTTRLAADEVALRELLHLFAKRRVEGPDGDAKHQEPYRGYERDLREALSLCDALLVSGEAEEHVARSYGYAGAIHFVGPVARLPVEPASIEHITGSSDFVLAHAPIAARSNQFFLLRAARQNGMPLVLAGPVSAADYYMVLREFADETVTFVPNPTEGELSALYRSARVFADVGWTSLTGHRLSHATLCGASVVCATTNHFGRLRGPGIPMADPASVESIAQALREAWNAGSDTATARAIVERVAAATDPTAVLAATVTAYSQAQDVARLNYVQA